MKTSEIRANIDSLLAIPSNEQCIGHFQLAVRSLLEQLLDEIEKLQKIIGTYRG